MKQDLQTALNILIQTRVNFRNLLDSLDEEKLFEIPQGFNNNIIWNFGHSVVSQQGLIYKMSGLETLLDADLVAKFGKGSTPTNVFEKGLKDQLIRLSFASLEKLQNDILKPEIFDNYKNYPTSYGYELTNITEAISFNNLHEGLHLGYAMAQRKAL